VGLKLALRTGTGMNWIRIVPDLCYELSVSVTITPLHIYIIISDCVVTTSLEPT
jgi:hypothetical protein